MKDKSRDSSLQYCLNYKPIVKILESFGNFIPISIVMVGDTNSPDNRRKQKWFDSVIEFDKKRRKFLGYD